MSYNQLYINGQWLTPKNGRTFSSIDPSNEQEIAQVAAASVEDAELAVQAARQAFDQTDWSQQPKQRAVYLRAIAQEIRQQLDQLAEIEVRDNGKPLPEAVWDIQDAAGCFDFYADLAEQLAENQDEQIPLSDERFSSVVCKEAVGVACAIIPWNYPLLMAAWKLHLHWLQAVRSF